MRASANCYGRGAKTPSAQWDDFRPTYYVQDGVIPRTKLPQTLRRITEISEKYGFQMEIFFTRRRESASTNPV